MAIVEYGVLAKMPFKIVTKAEKGLLLFFSNTAGREAALQRHFKQ